MSSKGLPKLPGYTFSDPFMTGRTNFGLPQTLKVLKGYGVEEGVPATVVADPKKEDLGPTPEQTLRTATEKLTVPNATQPSSTTPKWVAWDRRVLRFYGYFKEAVTESRLENYRIRRVVLFYYLEDDTLHVSEPKQDNSGIPQGVFVKRHRVTRQGGSGFFTPADFRVGGLLEVYGRVYHLVDCDEFTRAFYSENGMDQDPALPYPDDPISAYRDTFKKTSRAPPKASNDALTRFIEAKLGRATNTLDSDTLKNFLENNRKVLRFYCVWDDRENLYGDYRPYILHCYLEDDTMEVLEVHEPNSGRDPFPLFLRRSRIPKKMRRLDLSTKVGRDQCYGPSDLRIGEHVYVYGRPFLLYDCDEFTRQYYKGKFGATDEELQPLAVAEPAAPLPRMPLPEWNGYGTLEDSRQNCISLIPKPPKINFRKLMEKERMVLRFVVRILSYEGQAPSGADGERRLVLSYYLGNDTLSIFEPPIRNSGIIGGKFLERQKVFRPNSLTPFEESDFYVGAVVEIFRRRFEVVEADEFTLRYMESNAAQFPYSDRERVAAEVRAQLADLGAGELLKGRLIEADRAGTGQVASDELAAALSAVGVQLVKQQVITLYRSVDEANEGGIKIESLLSKVL